MLRLSILTAGFCAAAAATVAAQSSGYSSTAALSTTGAQCSRKDLDVLSCSAHADEVDTCCVNMPGGLVLQTQFWDWNPALGPKDSWTIHGLWPDFCNGSYPASCDDSRNYTNIVEILEDAGEKGLLKFMEKYWKNEPSLTGADGGDEELWAHEWGKHGTCMSTLSPSCYSHYQKYEEAVDFFKQTVHQFKQLPTHDFLCDCGIVPTNSTTYAIGDIEKCLAKAHRGYQPYVGCDDDGYLNEVWYYYYVKGKLYGGEYVPTNTTSESSCGEAVKYPPKL